MTEASPKKSNTLTTVLAVIGVAIVGVLVYAATKPDTFQIQRAARIAAPAEKIFPFINDFRAWPQWSPYEDRDPDMKRTYGATTAGAGATYGWEGNEDIGKGHMEILESAPPNKILIKLDFEKPFEAHNMAEFTLEPVGAETNVTWAMRGPQPYVSKLMTLFFNMDKMVGGDFETGLAKLKSVAEQSAAEPAPVEQAPVETPDPSAP